MSLQLSATRPRTLHLCGGKGPRTDLRLLEADDALLAEIAKGGVVIKGGPGDDAVLCTDTATYALKHVETTNALLLLPPDVAGDLEFGGAGSLTPPTDARGARDVGLQTQLAKSARADGAPPLTVTASAAAHIEAVRCPPRLGQLRELLSSCPAYGLMDEADGDDDDGDEGSSDGGEDEDGSDGEGGGGRAPGVGFTTRQLLELVQASRAELAAELAALGAVRLRGRWRAVDPAYVGQLLEVALLSATEHGWPLDAISASAAAAALAADGYRAPLVRHCLGRLFGARVKAPPGGSDGSGGDNGGGGSGEGNSGGAASEPVYALDRGRACLHFARKLLRGGGGGYGGDDNAAATAGTGGGGGAAPKWRYLDFMAAWAAAVPEEWSPPDAALLAGEALIEAPSSTTDGGGYSGGGGGERFVEAFAAADLPLEPRARFAALFARRPRWERPDLEPYLAGISGGGGPTVEALLLRHARASQATPNAPVLFSAR